jgi:acetolactate synthase-1/2/3 large subunit
MELPQRLVHLDIDPSVPGRNYPAASAVVGDAKLSTAALLDGLDRAGKTEILSEPGWLERVVAVTHSSKMRLRETLGTQVGLLDGLAACLPPTSVVVKDSTISAYTWGNRLLPVHRPRTSIMPNSFAIGLGLPQAVGAAVGSGEPVVLLVGDGGILLAATELATVAVEHLAIVIIIFVDGGYGILRNMQDYQFGFGEGRIGVDLGRPNFSELASAFGIEGVSVKTIEAYAAAVSRAIDSRQPCVIEVDLSAIGSMPVPFRGVSRPPVSIE